MHFTARSFALGNIPDLRIELPDDQVVVQELRRNEKEEIEITLQNMGESITVDLPGVGKTEIPAYALRTFRWK